MPEIYTKEYVEKLDKIAEKGVIKEVYKKLTYLNFVSLFYICNKVIKK